MNGKTALTVIPVILALVFTICSLHAEAVGFDDLYTTESAISSQEVAAESQEITAIKVLLSEPFINDSMKKYVLGEGAFKKLSFRFDPSNNCITVRGGLVIGDDVLLANGVPEAFNSIGFESTVSLAVTPSGFLSLTFPQDVTTAWFVSDKGETPDNRITVPTGFLPVAVQEVRNFLSAMSGDFSSFENRKVALNTLIQEEEERGSTLSGLEKEESDIKIAKHKLRLEMVGLKLKKAKRKASSGKGFIKFVSQADYKSHRNFSSEDNCILINADVQKMLPFLTGVRLAGVEIVENDGESFMKLTVKTQSGN